MTKNAKEILSIIEEIEAGKDSLPKMFHLFMDSLSRQEREILNLLNKKTWTSTTHIGQCMKRPNNHVGCILRNLYELGIIHKDKDSIGHECYWKLKLFNF